MDTIKIMLCFIFSILINTVHSQGPYPYNTTIGCSMNGLNSSYSLAGEYPPYQNQIIAPNTCQQSHPEYSESSCCTNAQTVTLSYNMAIGSPIFSPCPACLYNMWNLWCGSTCSPYQGSFMVPKKVDSNDRIMIIDFILHPDFAQGLYESCAGISVDGSTFGQLFPTALQFLDGLFTTNPTFKINWVLNTTGYNSETIPCSQSCSCEQCESACDVPHNMIYMNH